MHNSKMSRCVLQWKQTCHDSSTQFASSRLSQQLVSSDVKQQSAFIYFSISLFTLTKRRRTRAKNNARCLSIIFQLLFSSLQETHEPACHQNAKNNYTSVKICFLLSPASKCVWSSKENFRIEHVPLQQLTSRSARFSLSVSLIQSSLLSIHPFSASWRRRRSASISLAVRVLS